MTVAPVTPAEQSAVLELLAQHHLPLAGLSDHWGTTIVARDGARVIGSAALEVYADGALLRSVAVADDQRGRGVGQELTREAIAMARRHGVPALYLLTTTADAFFPKFGFARIGRDRVPASVQRSVEFTTACPSTAVVMGKGL